MRKRSESVDAEKSCGEWLNDVGEDDVFLYRRDGRQDWKFCCSIEIIFGVGNGLVVDL